MVKEDNKLEEGQGADTGCQQEAGKEGVERKWQSQ